MLVILLPEVMHLQIMPVLLACGFSTSQIDDILHRKDVAQKLRSSAASYRIFRKHGWNKMDSGWNPI